MTTDNRPEEFTGQWVCEFLERERIAPGSHSPSDDDCDQLAETLNVLRFDCSHDPKRVCRFYPSMNKCVPPQTAYYDKERYGWFYPLQLAISLMQTCVPDAIESLTGHLRAPRELWPGQQELCQEFVENLNALSAVMMALPGLQCSGPLSPRWHYFAFELAEEFRMAARRANRGRPLGLSNQGPVASFVAGMVPYITGETPSVEAVARELQREQKTKKRPFGTTISEMLGEAFDEGGRFMSLEELLAARDRETKGQG